MKLPYVLMPEKTTPIPLEQAHIPLNDRGFLFGDSLYEVIATRHGRPFFVEDHLDRLFASAAGVYMTLPLQRKGFKSLIQNGLSFYNGTDEVYIRIMVSRGSSDFNIDTSADVSPPRVYTLFKTAPKYTGRYAKEGFQLQVPTTRRNAPQSLNPAFKTGNYLNNILCLHEAKASGADDALILNLEGYVTEASTSNFFIVKNNTLITAPIDAGVLGGITRLHLIKVANALGIPVEERCYTLAEAFDSDERFVSSSLKGAMPVCRINSHNFAPGYGKTTRTLNTAYWEYVDAHLSSYATAGV